MWNHVVKMAMSMFCSHEWVRRHDRRRVYLECVHCLATTPGIEYGPPIAQPSRLRKLVKVAQA